MKNLIHITDFTSEEIKKIFFLADEIQKGKYKDFLSGKTVVMFFPDSSIRTRVTFEKGIHLLGGQIILFPPESLDKKEALKDVSGYLGNWADALIVRHKNIEVIKTLSKNSNVPVINAMTDFNHPCEIISDLYALSKMRKDFTTDNFLFCGPDGNIGRTWKEASEVFGFNLEQCCGKGFEMQGLTAWNNINEAITGKDIVCTDSHSVEENEAFKNCQVTKAAMDNANKGAVLNPCPPFYRGEEVSSDVIDSKYFAGYEFKKTLLTVQQAILVYCMMD